MTKELLKRCCVFFVIDKFKKLPRYAADHFDAAAREQKQQLKTPTVFLKDSLEEEPIKEEKEKEQQLKTPTVFLKDSLEEESVKEEKE